MIMTHYQRMCQLQYNKIQSKKTYVMQSRDLVYFNIPYSLRLFAPDENFFTRQRRPLVASL